VVRPPPYTQESSTGNLAVSREGSREESDIMILPLARDRAQCAGGGHRDRCRRHCRARRRSGARRRQTRTCPIRPPGPCLATDWLGPAELTAAPSGCGLSRFGSAGRLTAGSNSDFDFFERRRNAQFITRNGQFITHNRIQTTHWVAT
jgi:hypothetical protein